MEWHASGKPTECPLRRHCLLQPRSLDPKPRSRSNIELKPCGWPCLCLLPSAGLPTFTMTAHWGTQQRTGLWMWARPMLHYPHGGCSQPCRWCAGAVLDVPGCANFRFLSAGSSCSSASTYGKTCDAASTLAPRSLHLPTLSRLI